MNKHLLIFGTLFILIFVVLLSIALVGDRRELLNNNDVIFKQRQCIAFLKKEMNGYENQPLSKIQHLDFSYRQNLTGNEFRNLEALSDFQIETLDCSHSFSLTDDFSICLQWLPHLRRLNLRNTQITEKSMQEIACLSELESLHLMRAYDIHVSPDYWDMSNPFTDKTLEFLKKCHSLNFLLIGEPCTITDEGLKQLENFKKLDHLIIISSDITPEGFEYLKTLSWIRQIDIYPSAKDAMPPSQQHIIVHQDGDRYVTYTVIVHDISTDAETTKTDCPCPSVVFTPQNTASNDETGQ